jgi:hypothetical protein
MGEIAYAYDMKRGDTLRSSIDDKDVSAVDIQEAVEVKGVGAVVTI